MSRCAGDKRKVGQLTGMVQGVDEDGVDGQENAAKGKLK